jgi:hypothetical protein
MKWQYVAVVILGLVIGWWVFWKDDGQKSNNTKYIGSDAAEIASLNLPTRTVNDNKGVIKTVVEVQGIAKKWHSDTGMLDFESEGKDWSVEIDPKKTIIYTVGRKTKGVVIMVDSKESLHWNNVFCEGDRVLLQMEGSQVIVVDNAGFRYCGFKADQ